EDGTASGAFRKWGDGLEAPERDGGSRPSRLSSNQAAAADFGRRPRRAAAWPGSCPAQLSQRSACLEPRRASVKLRRIVAPFPSATSLPQLSHTKIVFRATIFLRGRECGKTSLGNIGKECKPGVKRAFSETSGERCLA